MPELSSQIPVDTYELAPRFAKYLRVTDVTDGLDAVGRADMTLLDPAIRPLWMGCRFWGVAVTMRVLPSNQRMPQLSRQDALLSHSLWAQWGGFGENLSPKLDAAIRPGSVIVTSTSEAMETGWWGSNNTMDMQSKGVVGIVTDGQCRDTDEVIIQQTPVACRGIGRPIIPGRTILADAQVPVGCGGVLVRPGDIVGCDWDGVVVVPYEVAEEVLAIAAAIAIDDKKGRRRLYEKLGKPMDETVDWEAAQQYYSDIL